MQTVDTVLDNIMNQYDHVSYVRSSLFEVVKKPLLVSGSEFENPNIYGLYRSTGGAPLGVVGDRFYHTQPVEIFDAFVKSLVEINADLNGLTVKEVKGGSRLLISAPFKTYGYKNLVGKDDVMTMRATAMIAFDGLCSKKIFVDAYRMICVNLTKAWRTEFDMTFKNTQNNAGALEYVLNDVTKLVDVEKKYSEYIKALQSKQFNNKEYKEFIHKIVGVKDDKKISGKTQGIIEKIEMDMAKEINDCGTTAWALLNGITRYTNHSVKKDKTEVLDFLYAGKGATLNDDAQKLVHEMFLAN